MEDKKIDLLKAAYEVFKEKGYKKTNISEIAKKANIAVGSFYKHYQSKEEIFLKIYIEENNKIRNNIMSQIDWDGKVEAVVDELFSYILESVLNNKILIE